jgi:PAS domain S-box-containing protein
MTMSSDAEKDLLRQNAELTRRLEEAEGTLRALRNGEVDAIIASGPHGDQVYTLRGADAVYRLMVQKMAEGAVTLLPDGIILFTNEQFALTVGVASTNLPGVSMSKFIDAQDTPAFAALLDGSSTVATQVRLMHQGGVGEKVPVRISANQLTLDETKYVCLVVTDLSEQEKRNQELAELVNALRQSEYFLERTGRMAGIGGWEFNVATGSLDWSNESYRIHGVQADFQPEYTRALGFFAPEDRPAIQSAWERCLNEGVGWNLEVDLDRADGSRITVRSIGSAEFADGKPVRLMGTVQDITEAKLAEARLREAIEKAELANRAKSQFLANMSHEIRTPMNAILGLTLAALRANPTAKQQAYLSKISSASESLLNIINDILDFSKIEAGMLQMEMIPFSLPACLHKISELLAFKAQQKDITFEINVAPHVPSTLTGDPLRLEQILINLVSNAIKFSDKGSVIVSVDSSPAGPETAGLTFSITDNGIGMSPEQTSALFQSFNQADASTTRKYGGTGLGLAISKHLAERMGGSISVQSQLGKGSTFILTANFQVPSQSLAVGEAPRDSNPVSKSALILEAEEYPEFPGRSVLVVDDNELNREVASGLLERLGICVTEAIDGRDALQKLYERTFDLVLMDIQMPGMDGLMATRSIRSDERFFHLPIIAMTAHGMVGDRDRSLAAGMNDHLVKPIIAQHLNQILLKWMPVKREIAPPPQRRPLQRELSVDLLPASLPPLHLHQALARINGNQKLLRRALFTFRDKYAQAAIEVRQQLNRQRLEEVRALAHSIKGAASTVGATELAEAATALEDHLAGPQISAIDPLLISFENALVPVIAAINSIEEPAHRPSLSLHSPLEDGHCGRSE